MMLGLADIRDWLKQLDSVSVSEIDEMLVEEVEKLKIKQLAKSNCIIADHFYIGKLDNKEEKSIGVYQLRTSRASDIALGGQENTKTLTKSVSILIHWNKNARDTEEKALELYIKLLTARNFKINNLKINYIELLVNEPVDVGTDENNVYERVIEAIFYYEKGE